MPLMAWASIAYRCGHTATKQLHGPHADRERYVAWCARHADCPACAEAAADAHVAAVEAEYDLPPLTGTERQVAWGRKLRIKLIGDYLLHADGIRERVPAKNMGQYEETRAAFLVAMAGKTAASWWIDHQHTGAREITNELHRELTGC